MTDSRSNRQRFGRKSILAFVLVTLAIAVSILFACTRETTTVQTVIVEREITVEPDVVVQTVVFEREITVKPEIEVQTVVVEREVTSEPNIVVVEREVPATPQIVVQTVLVERVVTAEPKVIVVEREVTVVQTVVVERVVTSEPEIVVVERVVTVEPETAIQTVIVGPKPLPSPEPTPEIEFNSPLAICQPIPVWETGKGDSANVGVPASAGSNHTLSAGAAVPIPILPPQTIRPPLTTFQDNERQPWNLTSEDDTSTFSLDTDRTSFHLARNWVKDGYDIVPDSVRAEEWINSFEYNYPSPTDSTQFGISTDITRHPLDPDLGMVRLTFRAPEVEDEFDLNVTMVLDASGSMADGNRVAIARAAAETLRQSLGPNDRVSIVHFTTDVIDELTVANASPDDGAAEDSIARLFPHESTNVQAGLNLGVQLAHQMRTERPDALNYIMLFSDGVANVDATNPFAILDTATDVEPDNPLRLVTIGVGVANYNDVLLEQLAQHGNGWYRYLTVPEEGETLFNRENWLALSVPFADQTRAQVTWNPEKIERWRLIGYENRVTSDESFDQALKKFAEIPSGAATTVYFEIAPVETIGERDGASDFGNVEIRWVSPEDRSDRQQDADILPGPDPNVAPHFAAIIALTADRYSNACNVEPTIVNAELLDLIERLQDIDPRYATSAAYVDLLNVLEKLIETTAPPPPSGYSP